MNLEQQLVETQEELHQMKTDLAAVISAVFGAAKKMGIDPSKVKDFKIDEVPVIIGQLVMNFQMGMITLDSLGLNNIMPVLEKYAHLIPTDTETPTPTANC